MLKNFLITGGSGFVGSHVIKNIINQKQINSSIDVLDNLTTFSKISDKEKIRNKEFREKIRLGVKQYFEVDTCDYRSLMDIISSKQYDLTPYLLIYSSIFSILVSNTYPTKPLTGLLYTVSKGSLIK